MPRTGLADAFVTTLTPAVRQAAAIAAALEGRVANHPKRGEGTPVKAALTVADTAAQEALLVPLLGRFRTVALDAEENTPSVERFSGEAADTQVVIDPIDGTLRFFLQGRGPYAVMAGLALHQRFEAALVALPREGLFLTSVRGGGARCARGSEAFAPVRACDDGRDVLVSHDLPDPVLKRLRESGYRPRAGCGGAIAVAPLLPGSCAGLRVAPERHSISRRGRIGLLIACEAGALTGDGSGASFPDEIDAARDTLIVAANAGHHDALLRALRG